LCWRKERSVTSVAEFGANRKRNRGEKTPETATPFPESTSVSPPRHGKDKEQRNPENEVAETDL